MSEQVYTVRVEKTDRGVTASMTGGILDAPVTVGPAATQSAVFVLLASFVRRVEHMHTVKRGVSGVRRTPIQQTEMLRLDEQLTAAVQKMVVRFGGKVARLRLSGVGVNQRTELLATDGSVLASVYVRESDGVRVVQTEVPVR